MKLTGKFAGEPKNLLHEFDGCLKPGEMCLVLGRPGSGCVQFSSLIVPLSRTEAASDAPRPPRLQLLDVPQDDRQPASRLHGHQRRRLVRRHPRRRDGQALPRRGRLQPGGRRPCGDAHGRPDAPLRPARQDAGQAPPRQDQEAVQRGGHGALPAHARHPAHAQHQGRQRLRARRLGRRAQARLDRRDDGDPGVRRLVGQLDSRSRRLDRSRLRQGAARPHRRPPDGDVRLALPGRRGHLRAVRQGPRHRRGSASLLRPCARGEAVHGASHSPPFDGV